MYIHCTYYTLHFPLHLNPENPLSFGHHPPHLAEQAHGTTRTRTLPIWLTTNGTLAQIFFPLSAVSRFVPPKAESPVSDRQRFPFISSLHRQRGSHNLHPLPWRAFIYPDMHPRQRQTDACSVPTRILPRSRLPVNPVRPALTLPLSPLRIVGSHPPSQRATPVNSSRKKNEPAVRRIPRSTHRFADATAAETGCPSAVDQPHAIDRLHFPKGYA